MKSNFAEPPRAGSAGQPGKGQQLGIVLALSVEDIPVCSRGSQSV